MDSQSKETLSDVDKESDKSKEVSESYFDDEEEYFKQNKDYQKLMDTVVLLQYQRIKAFQNLEKVRIERQKALKDPVGFVAKLQAGETVSSPAPLKVATLPRIRWERYSAASACMSQSRWTRNRPQSPVIKRELPRRVKSENSSEEVVRGRVKSKGKSVSFNQLWTVEEQRRLEELLVKFPPERIESRRYSKIAKALGNRTKQQVASRVQKYFVRLTKAGLPVPGRKPGQLSLNPRKRVTSNTINRYRRPATALGTRYSSFLHAFHPPVLIPDQQTLQPGEQTPQQVQSDQQTPQPGEQTPQQAEFDKQTPQQVQSDQQTPHQAQPSEQTPNFSALDQHTPETLVDQQTLATLNEENLPTSDEQTLSTSEQRGAGCHPALAEFQTPSPIESDELTAPSPHDTTSVDYAVDEDDEDNECTEEVLDSRPDTPLEELPAHVTSSSCVTPPSRLRSAAAVEFDVSDEEDVPESLRSHAEYRQILMLKSIRSKQRSTNHNTLGASCHGSASEEFGYLYPD